MLIKTTELAIAVLAFLAEARHDAPTTAQSISAWLGTSPTYTRKVIQLLNRKGFTQIRRGAGLELVRPAEDILLIDVVELCQGEVLADCADCAAQADCDQPCVFAELRLAIRRALSAWTIDDLSKGRHQRYSVVCLQSIVSSGRPHFYQPAPFLTPLPVGEQN